MPSASSCFLLSFCFRKVVRGSFSESAANLQDLFLRGKKDGARRAPAGGPTGARRPQARPTPWPCMGPTWSAPSSTRAALSPINHLRPENPMYPIIFSRKHARPPPLPTLDREGSAALSGTLPERGIIIGGIYTTMHASGVMCE